MRLAWQTLARSHYLFTSHCHSAFLPFRFVPSPSEAPRPTPLLAISYLAIPARNHGNITRPELGTGYESHRIMSSFPR